MENIRSNNVYLEMADREEEKEEAPNEDVDRSSTKGKKQKLPRWMRSTDGEGAKYADWTIDLDVSNYDDDDDDTTDIVSYSVHRYQLGLQSEYFEGIFRDPDEGGFSESYQKRSVIKLPIHVVTIRHFENLLDYLYTNNLVLDSNSAISMVYFGDYFGINLLKEQAQSFIRKSIAAATISATKSDTSVTSSSKLLMMFYQDAKSLAMDELQEAIIYECASEPALMSPDTALSKISDVQFWCRVWAAKKSHPQTELSNQLWSINIAHCFERHSDSIDIESFIELTNRDSLPIISAHAAVVIMKQEQRICEIIAERDNRNSTCLRQRCIDSLIDSDTGHWKVSHPHQLLERNLGNMPRSMLESLLLCTMGDRNKPHGSRDSIRVSGAGTESVNGVYIKSGLYEGYPMFNRSGNYEGYDVLYSIYKIDGYFYISCRWDGYELYFYETITSREEKLPPDNGWEIGFSGQGPLPTLEFVYA